MNSIAIKRTLKILGLALLSGACTEEASQAPPEPVGLEGVEVAEERVFGDDGQLLDPRGDADGDGIPNADEILGYTITVDVNGFGVVDGEELLEVREVTSDPRLADTDGDGVEDGVERAATSDPRRVDSDGDTLSDYDELFRWRTSPVSIDTDGDARGGDPENPRPPRFQLFDAAELRLELDPAGSGRLVVGPGATNPTDADTDGDGLNDYEELGGDVRRPTIAELPSVRILQSPGSEVTIGLVTTSSEGVTDSSTYTVSSENGNSITSSTSMLTESSLFFETYAELYITEEATVGCCLDIVDSDTRAGVLVKQDQGVSTSLSVDTSIGYAYSMSETEERVRAQERTSSLTVEGGLMRISIDLMNDSAVPLRVNDMTFSVYEVTRKGLTPIGELFSDDDVVLSPGGLRTVFLERLDLEIDAVRRFMRGGQNLLIAPTNYNISDAEDVNTDFRFEDVNGRCAHISINFSDGLVIEEFVAAPQFAEGSARSVGSILEELGIDYDAELVPGSDPPFYQVSINGVRTELHPTEPPELFEALPYTERSRFGPGPRRVRRGWYIWVERADPDAAPNDYYANFFEARVYPGDRVTLIFGEDLDQDGVPAVIEERFGSSDEALDSDSDGLSDFWEIRENWVVQVVGVPDYAAAPSPASPDFDNDGLSDAQEALLGTDPRMRDTDLDGLDDKVEFEQAQGAYQGELDPVNREDSPDAASISCVATLAGENKACNENGDICSNVWVSIAPSGLAFARQLVPIEWFDTLSTCLLANGISAECLVRVDSSWDPALHLEVPKPFIEELRDNIDNIDPVLGVKACGGSCLLKFPHGVDASCMVLISETEFYNLSMASQWTALPCSSLVDNDLDGRCETVTPPLEAPNGVVSAFTNYGPPPTCSSLRLPVQTFSIEITEPQGDLTTLEWFYTHVNSELWTMKRSFESTGALNFEFEVDTCLDPSQLTVRASDALGFAVETTCTTEGDTCTP